MLNNSQFPEQIKNPAFIKQGRRDHEAEFKYLIIINYYFPGLFTN